MISFYIASSGDRLADVVALSTRLEGRGMRNAFAWHEHWHHKCSSEVCGIRDRQDLAAREIEAASTCDVFVGIARMGKGSHVEFGMALGGGHAQRFILVGVNVVDLVFYEYAYVEHAATVADVERMIMGDGVASKERC